MKLHLDRGSLTTNHHESNGEMVRGWTVRVVKLETFRRLSTGTEAIQALAGRRLWIYAPSGRCWNFDIYLTPTIKPCKAYSVGDPSTKECQR